MNKNEKYATCKVCCHQMEPKRGCTLSHLIINGKSHERIKVCSPQDLLCNEMDESFICHDCNAGAGQYHHLGCDSERCVVCQDQLFLCDCDMQAIVPILSISPLKINHQ